VRQLAAALRPFILRRTKKQVLADLPEKTEQTIVCEMEPAQRQIYDEMRLYYRAHLLKTVRRQPRNGRRRDRDERVAQSVTASGVGDVHGARSLAAAAAGGLPPGSDRR